MKKLIIASTVALAAAPAFAQEAVVADPFASSIGPGANVLFIIFGAAAVVGGIISADGTD